MERLSAAAERDDPPTQCRALGTVPSTKLQAGDTERLVPRGSWESLVSAPARADLNNGGGGRGLASVIDEC